MAARLRVLQPGNPECASEREAKENEMAGGGGRGWRKGGGGKKEDAKRKSGGEKSPLVSLFLFRDARLFTFHPVRAYVYIARVYIYIRACVGVCVCVHTGCSYGLACVSNSIGETRRNGQKRRSDFESVKYVRISSFSLLVLAS